MAQDSDDDYMHATKLLQRLKDNTSVSGQGTAKKGDFALQVSAILREERPRASVIALAGWMTITHNAIHGDWQPEIVGCLEDAFRMRMNDDQISTQQMLAASNDRLGRKMFWLAWAALAVAVAGVAVAVAQLVKG